MDKPPLEIQLMLMECSLKLETLALWFDCKYKDDKNPQVQTELRRWAKELRELGSFLNKD